MIWEWWWCCDGFVGLMSVGSAGRVLFGSDVMTLISIHALIIDCGVGDGGFYFVYLG